jgi:hypothetical protein
MPRIKIKDLPSDLKIGREEMKKIAGGAVDTGVLLVEMMAAIGDSLSAYQDAVANEAYLGIARQRNSQVARKRWRD